MEVCINSLRNILKRIEQGQGVDGLVDAYDSTRKTPEKSHETQLTSGQKELKKTRTAHNRAIPRPKKNHHKKREQANLRVIARLRKQYQNLIARGTEPKGIPYDIYVDCQVIISDRTSKTIQGFSRQLKNKIGLARINRSALGIRDDGKALYSYRGDSRGSQRARAIFATGWLLWRLSRGTNRKGPWNRLVTGLPQKRMIAAITPYGERKHVNTFTGKRREGENPWDIGYLDALKESGFCYTRQAKWSVSKGNKPTAKGWEDYRESEKGGERNGLAFSLARYWIISDQYSASSNPEFIQKMLVDYVAGCQPIDVWISDQTPMMCTGKQAVFGVNPPREKPPPN